MRSDVIARMNKSTKSTIEGTIPNIVEKRLSQLRKEVTDGVMSKTRESVDKLLPEVFADRVDELKKDSATRLWKELEPLMAARGNPKIKTETKIRTPLSRTPAERSTPLLLRSKRPAVSRRFSGTLLEGASQFTGRASAVHREREYARWMAGARLQG